MHVQYIRKSLYYHVSNVYTCAKRKTKEIKTENRIKVKKKKKLITREYTSYYYILFFLQQPRLIKNDID